MLTRLLIFAFVLMTSSIFAQTPTIETGVPQILAKWRAANYSDVRYKLNLTLEKMSPTLKGTIEIRINVRQNGGETKKQGDNSGSFQRFDSLPTIILDWRKIKGKENLSTISNVSVNGRFVVLNPDFSKFNFIVEGREEQNFFEINEHLVFQDGVKLGENVIKLDFTSPIATSGAAITRYVDKEDGAEYIYSLFVPSDASTAVPVFDQPDLKARFSLKIKIPDDWKVISNNLLTRVQTLPGSHTEDARKKLYETTFVETQPISTYVFAFAAGEFAEFEDTKKETISFESTEDIAKNNGIVTRIYSGTPKIYVRKSQAEKFKQHAAEVFRLNREGVKFLESYFDYKFPFPKYDLVLIPEFPFRGMEHAGATFLREDSIIFPQEPTKNDYVSRANVIFHEAAHQWFGDTVTMRWFDDLWLKEGFAEFMAYKTLAKVMPEYNAWKIFYERNKQLAYLTDATKGTTPIYQEIPNLSAAKSAYGNIVYRKAPSFLRQAEFYLGEDKFQIAVRAFLKKHEFANAEWTDLVKEFETASKQDLKDWADSWVKQKGVSVVKFTYESTKDEGTKFRFEQNDLFAGELLSKDEAYKVRRINFYLLTKMKNGKQETFRFKTPNEVASRNSILSKSVVIANLTSEPDYLFPNYQDYGYGIFLLDEKSRAYVLENIQNEKDDFLRAMMWGSLWDSVREAELAPADYVRLVIKNLNVETDESTIQTLLGRVSTAMNYYLSDAQSKELAAQLETLLIEKMQNAPTLGQRITFYRAFLNVASTDKARTVLKDIQSGKLKIKDLNLKLKDRYDILIRLGILGDKDAMQEIYKKVGGHSRDNMSDEERRYVYASGASVPDKEIKQYYFNLFLTDKNVSESYTETAFVPFNSIRHSELTLPFLEKALAELPNLKRNRKIFFINGWLAAFIGGQKSEQALAIVNKFLGDNANLDKDLRLKILEASDGLERSIKIRQKFAGK